MIKYSCNLCSRDESELTDKETLRGVKVSDIKKCDETIKSFAIARSFTIHVVPKHEAKAHLCSTCMSEIMRWG